jgi:hypothetical protein
MLHEDEIRLRYMLDHAREAVAMIAELERIFGEKLQRDKNG